ncbi:hypothetical protein GCM10023178_31900 [Actinomadura luteofluorescens]
MELPLTHREIVHFVGGQQTAEESAMRRADVHECDLWVLQIGMRGLRGWLRPSDRTSDLRGGRWDSI